MLHEAIEDDAMIADIIEAYFQRAQRNDFDSLVRGYGFEAAYIHDLIQERLLKLSKRAYGLVNPIRFLKDPIFRD